MNVFQEKIESVLELFQKKIDLFVHYIDDLSPREKLLLAVGSIILVPFFFYMLVLEPLENYHKKLDRLLKKEKSKIVEASLLNKEYEFLLSKTNSTHLPFKDRLEQLLIREELKDKSTITIESSTQRIQVLRLDLNSLYIDQMPKILFQIENSLPAMKVKQLEISFSDPKEKLLQMKLLLESET